MTQGPFMTLLRTLWHMPGRTWRGALLAAPLRTWAIMGAAPILTAASAGLVWIVWKGPWAIDRQPQQLDILGAALYGCILIILVIVVALAGLGIAATVNKGGVTLNVGDDDHDHLTGPTTTVTVETTAPATPSGAADPDAQLFR